jgi:transposase-like protein
MKDDIQEKARSKAAIIMAVRSKEITATEGARRLGISRKTYYQWENRGLQGMLQALEEQPPGRPENQTDPEKETLQKENQKLKQELETALQSREVLKRFHDYELQKAKTSNKPGKAKQKKKKRR